MKRYTANGVVRLEGRELVLGVGPRAGDLLRIRVPEGFDGACFVAGLASVLGELTGHEPLQPPPPAAYRNLDAPWEG